MSSQTPQTQMGRRKQKSTVLVHIHCLANEFRTNQQAPPQLPRVETKRTKESETLGATPVDGTTTNVVETAQDGIKQELREVKKMENIQYKEHQQRQKKQLKVEKKRNNKERTQKKAQGKVSSTRRI